MSDYSFEVESIKQAVWEASGLLSAPHTRMRPHIFPDGDMWCALYGKDLQEGVAGFGKTPDLACVDFDKNWYHQTLRGMRPPQAHSPQDDTLKGIDT